MVKVVIVVKVVKRSYRFARPSDRELKPIVPLMKTLSSVEAIGLNSFDYYLFKFRK